jgi:DHA2 family multidrug resistance protein
LLVPNLVRALGQALIMTPLSAMATGGIERANAGSASALFNMMRNLGGSVGIAVLETFVTKREQFHSNIITTNVTLLNEATRQRIGSLQSYFMANGVADAGSAWHEAVVQIGRTVRAQSYFLAYSDAFCLMGAALLLALLTTIGMRKSSGGGAGAH